MYMTRALVTGSTGFVGANLVKALNEHGIEVVGLRRTTSPDDAVAGLKVTPVVGDLLDLESLHAAMEGIDWVFHVAAVADYWQVPKEVIYRVNVEGTRNILRAARQAGVKRFVLTGSTAALGIPSPEGSMMNEHSRFNLKPDDFPYGHSKHLAEEIMVEYVEKGLHAVSVLPSIVLGPRDLKFNAGELIAQALKPTIPLIPLPLGGAGYIDVRDCAKAHITAAEKGQPGERYVLSGHNLTHRETVGRINQVLGTSLRLVQIPRWTLPPLGAFVSLLHKLGIRLALDRGRVMLSGQFMYYDNGKAVRELGLQIRPFEESVYDAYRWYADNGYLEKHGLPLAPISRSPA
jgi:dihydroflavonol-4-reductase